MKQAKRLLSLALVLLLALSLLPGAVLAAGSGITVTVTPAAASVQRGNTQTFTVDVTGTDDKAVTWSVSGSEPLNSYESIVSTQDSATGILRVQANESAETLTVRATSVADPTKYGEATVTVLPRPQVDGTVAITYDTSAVRLLSTSTGEAVSLALANSLTCSRSRYETGSWHAIISWNGDTIVPNGWTCLCYKDPSSSSGYYTLGGSNSTLDPAAEYYLCFDIAANADYEINPEQLPAVTINGTPADDVRWGSRLYTGDFYAYRRIGMEDVFEIVSQPEDVWGTVGDTAEFHVGFAGEASFQWQYSTDQASWTNSTSSGNKTGTLRIGITTAREKYYYRCRITSPAGEVAYTDPVRLHVVPSVDEAMNAPGGNLHFSTGGSWPWAPTTVDGIPCAQSGNAGQEYSESSVSLSCSLTESTILSFEYFVSGEYNGETLYDFGKLEVDGREDYDFENPDTGGWVTYAVPLTRGTHTIRWIYYKDGSTDSGEDCFRVRNVRFGEMPVSIKVQPLDFTGGVGETFTFHTEVLGGDASYQWQRSSDGGTTWSNTTLNGCKTDTLSDTITVARMGYCYRCKITVGSRTIYTDTVRIVETPLAILSESSSQNGWIGQEFSFSVRAEGSVLSYQWQIKTAGTTDWEPCTLSGSDTSTVTGIMTEALINAYFQCIVTDRLGNTKTTSALQLREGGIELVQEPGNFIGYLGDSFTFHLEANGSLLTYQWEVSTDGGETWKSSTLSGNKTNTLTGKITAARLGYLYRCVMTNCFDYTLTTEPVRVCSYEALNDALNVPGGNLRFTTEQPYPWFPTTVDGNPVASSSNAGIHNSESELALHCSLTEEAPLTFEYYVSGEYSGVSLYDFGSLYVNGYEDMSFRIADSQGWQTYTMTLSPGEYTIRWKYSKDSSNHSGDDCFMLRNVSLDTGTPLTITQQPVDYVGAEGSTASFTVGAEGDGLTYQWWIRNPGETEFTKSTRKTATYSTTLKAASNGRELYCVVTDSHGNSITTNTVTMSIATLAITQQPVDYVGAEGSTASFTVVAQGDGLTYQWWIRNPGETEFTKSTRKTATYSTTLKAASSGRELYCVVTDSHGNSITTNTVTMSIATLAITQQPVDYVGAEGSTASFTVVAQGDGLTYQWWIRNPGESDFSVSTRKTATYSTTLKAASSGRELYCVVTDSHGNSVTTNTVTMSIATLTITQQPVDYVGAEGSTASFTVVAQGDGLTYQWWIRNPGESDFSVSTRRTATYSTTLKAASNGRELYCVVTDSHGNSVTTNTVTMSIATLTITQQPVDYVGAEGSTASFTVVAQGDGLTYQWWIRNPGESDFSVSTRRTATYSTTLKAASNGRELYCVVTDSHGNSVTTNTVTMSIATLTITQQPVDYVGAEGSTATFTVVAQGDGLTYQWWIRNPGESDFSVSTRKTATYSTTLKAASNGRELYCVVTDSHGNSVTTNTVTMSIATLTITQQPVDYVGAEGSTASFTVVAQGDGLTYQWWIRNPGESDFSVSTRKTATYSTTLKAASNGRELYCVVTDSHGNSVTTNTVTMSIG